uniref:Myb/SANT-like domain-containing protein n=1 Tax=Oryza rufipogon TaxID=4529 RepID=A0A0E0PIW1_ORYRU
MGEIVIFKHRLRELHARRRPRAITRFTVGVFYLQFSYDVCSMGNRTEDNSKEGGSREKYITWSDDATQFMLEWYISLRKDKPTTFKWRKQHHQQCATALNDKLGLRVNRSQVHRHFRLCKEKWSWICAALGKSGYGFDATSCKFNIDPSEKEANKLGVSYSMIAH